MSMGNFVTTDWLAAHLDDPGLRIVDASWHLPPTGRDGDAEFVRRVFQESMRLYPPAWIFAREAMREVPSPSATDGKLRFGHDLTPIVTIHPTLRAIKMAAKRPSAA